MLDLDCAVGHAAEAGPEDVQERDVGLGVGLGEAWAAGVDPQPEKIPMSAARISGVTASLADRLFTWKLLWLVFYWPYPCRRSHRPRRVNRRRPAQVP